MRQDLANRLNKAVNRQGPQHPEARRICAKATTRDTHPTTGSESILAAANAGVGKVQISSLNTDSGGRAFCFDVEGFGWDQAEIS